MFPLGVGDRTNPGLGKKSLGVFSEEQEPVHGWNGLPFPEDGQFEIRQQLGPVILSVPARTFLLENVLEVTFKAGKIQIGKGRPRDRLLTIAQMTGCLKQSLQFVFSCFTDS